jgi:tryptophan synthase alpha chain
MSYLNPLLIYGYEALARDAAGAGVCGFIVPDLPLEESGELRGRLDAQGLALISLVTPATPRERVQRLCDSGRGFIYAVTVTGITGGAQAIPADVSDYLDRVKACAGAVPVCAGFGVREAAQVERLGRHADGVIVGSALVEELEAGRDPVAFLEALRPGLA